MPTVIGSSLIHNLVAMNGARNMGIVTNDQKKSAEKLSSGYRVNRAADDAAGLAISEKMRRQIRGLDQTVRNINEGIQLCNVADGALNEISSMLHRQEELLVQAANDTNTYSDREYIQAELKQLSDEMNRSFDITTYNEIQLFKGKDTILDDPPPQVVHTVNTRTETDPTVKTVTESIITSVDSMTTTTETNTAVTHGGRTSSYSEWEQVHDTDENGHTSYEVHSAQTITDGPETTTVTKVTKEYEKLPADPKATQLTSPATMTGRNGYINVKNGLGWQLSCAMSRLGVKIGDNVNLDLYSSSSITVNPDPGENAAEHTYNLGDGLSLTQRIELQDGNKYVISYSMKNEGTEDKTASVRLAFDSMNTFDNTNNKSTTGAGPYTLKSDKAEIALSATGATKTVLGNIDAMYYQWDSNVVDGDVIGHSGMGTWWENKTVGAGETLNLGSVTYGPITVADQYKCKTTTEVDVTREYTDTTDDDTYAYMPRYLDIQVGVEKGQLLPIRLWDLDTTTLHCRVPEEISAHAAGDSIQYLKHAMHKVSSIRSYYGATTNRLEHAARNNANVSENTSAAESRIRDTDMALEMVSYSNNSILMQSGQSMLAQANSSPERILQLLS